MRKVFGLILLITTNLSIVSCISTSKPHSTQTTFKNADGETVHRTITPIPQQDYGPEPRHSEIQIQPVIAINPITIPASKDSTGTLAVFAKHNPIALTLESAITQGNLHLGGHIGMNWNDNVETRLGWSLFFSKDVYSGIDLSTRFRFPIENLKPFLGLGIYMGSTEECSTVRSAGYDLEVCDKKYLSSGYGELGIEYQNFSLFIRDYRLVRADLRIPTNLFWGIGYRF